MKVIVEAAFLMLCKESQVLNIQAICREMLVSLETYLRPFETSSIMEKNGCFRKKYSIIDAW